MLNYSNELEKLSEGSGSSTKVTLTMNKLKSDPEKLKRIISGSSLPLPPIMGKN